MINKEHYYGTPNPLCGLIEMESAFSDPLKMWFAEGDQARDPAQHPSTCIHILYLVEILLISSKSSKDPMTVDPAIELTKNGVHPSAISY